MLDDSGHGALCPAAPELKGSALFRMRCNPFRILGSSLLT